MWIKNNLKKKIETEYFTNNISKRKTAVASTFIFFKLKEENKKNNNYFFINNKNIFDFTNKSNYYKNKILIPLIISKIYNNFNFYIFSFVKGGGFLKQFEILNISLTRSLLQIICKFESIKNLQIIKQLLIYKKDSRNKERRKFGLKKARKSSQYHKR